MIEPPFYYYANPFYGTILTLLYQETNLLLKLYRKNLGALIFTMFFTY